MNWMIIPENPVLSGALVVVLAIAFLYFARTAVHTALLRSARLIAALIRTEAKVLTRVIDNLKSRNREVLLEMGKGQFERKLNRDFHRVNEIVTKDLSNYPELYKQISTLVTKLEEDYHQSAETSPPSPDWVEAIEAIVNLKEAQKGNPVIVKVLEDLHSSLNSQQKKTLDTPRHGASTRHRLLHSMMPNWRKLNNETERVGGSMKNLILQAEDIDKNMDRYQDIQAGSDKAVRMLQVSSITRLFYSLAFMGAALGGAFFNFHLIALPMSEMVGAVSRIGSFTVAEVSALMVVALEITVGMLLLEVLQITRLFPVFSTLDERKRRILLWAFIGLILLFASVEAGLAFMRDQIAADNSALKTLLVGGEAVISESTGIVSTSIPQIAQMTLAFILPFVLMFTAIPFEMFIESSRVLIGELVIQLLHLVVVVMRLVSVSIKYLVDILLAIYDIVVSIPLWIESKLSNRQPGVVAETRLSKETS